MLLRIHHLMTQLPTYRPSIRRHPVVPRLVALRDAVLIDLPAPVEEDVREVCLTGITVTGRP